MSNEPRQIDVSSIEYLPQHISKGVVKLTQIIASTLKKKIREAFTWVNKASNDICNLFLVYSILNNVIFNTKKCLLCFLQTNDNDVRKSITKIRYVMTRAYETKRYPEDLPAETKVYPVTPMSVFDLPRSFGRA